jgi:hypothetical protein
MNLKSQIFLIFKNLLKITTKWFEMSNLKLKFKSFEL